MPWQASEKNNRKKTRILCSRASFFWISFAELFSSFSFLRRRGRVGTKKMKQKPAINDEHRRMITIAHVVVDGQSPLPRKKLAIADQRNFIDIQQNPLKNLVISIYIRLFQSFFYQWAC